ncbi:hypothetical protein GCM10009677_61950 [Sphaerisporangium rubeum]|uniref:Uncharacterized protein n=1 Tax=Sphaerisporangium rubeum TaxID=321317 RepID=A0A7X0M5Y5_9ACTN|nr:hypothetical protein [Sphaerisporangium rubeum]MBB6471439.1 hypothetical protein [Sphaerisporangium rubeum]
MLGQPIRAKHQYGSRSGIEREPYSEIRGSYSSVGIKPVGHAADSDGYLA